MVSHTPPELRNKRRGITANWNHQKQRLYFNDRYFDWTTRNDPALVAVVERLGKEAETKWPLRIVEIPDDIKYTIVYDDETREEYVLEVPDIPRRTWR